MFLYLYIFTELAIFRLISFFLWSVWWATLFDSLGFLDQSFLWQRHGQWCLYHPEAARSHDDSLSSVWPPTELRVSYPKSTQKSFRHLFKSLLKASNWQVQSTDCPVVTRSPVLLTWVLSFPSPSPLHSTADGQTDKDQGQSAPALPATQPCGSLS